ncbi:pimeloyl-ACP methyl ester esterase BioH [Serratia odorifera]|jgi:pimeloyl-[acyl-carrier protein] methyl ester esterase|uniref:Pimeloyl-[acyl-carrier protein] methyl ester esterase n=2 Tax=Serratia odorifera TaxID=618 RepID=D4DYQ0_SEROD|nr:pimeloyl-ACP methyl ester esterase BioH [Serratia odorifera]EFE97222.1 carboxylesterase BioH [Serratia odorifera DSM 4582]MBJ2066644.1 pimeloyl-ACP methyl ester esterase BioH [Serratia odorifera]PNK91811.1 pimeloyl-[acyl-carrier protein] methyl ester esterase [Serratia odorifera]RII72853.1 pimeloyl-[acyl-carrier protein] methyl ester esterase [Serratia odorifera]VDZ54389.1 Pimelyl-[acyl-carrier protein] methyl ester esterase [Serratia odorifera]
MSALYWKTMGEGDRDLVLLHGWGLNAEVWGCTLARLAPHFRLHLLDLPGYGRSQGYAALTLQQMAEIVLEQAPAKAWWLGWSLGGLVASQIALTQPQRTCGLISVASSPCFHAEEDWPGIRPNVLSGFQQQLSQDFQRTVERFLTLQTLGTASARQDARTLKGVVLNQPIPSVEVLNGGLEMLRTVDLRRAMTSLSPALPLLRIYGYLDGLVPRKVAALVDDLLPASRSVIIDKAAHAPFISHPDEFADVIKQFVDNSTH